MTAAELNAAERAEAERRRRGTRYYDDPDEDDGYVSPGPRPYYHDRPAYEYDDYDRERDSDRDRERYAHAPSSPRFRLRAMSPPRYPSAPAPPPTRYLPPPPDRRASFERNAHYDDTRAYPDPLPDDDRDHAHHTQRAHNRDAALLLEDDLGMRSPDRVKDLKKRSRAPTTGADVAETSPVRAPPSAKKRRVQPEYDYDEPERDRDRDRDRDRELDRYARPPVVYDPNGPSALSLAPDADTDVRMLSAYPHLHVPTRLPSPPLQAHTLPLSESPPPPAIVTTTRGRGGGKGSRGGRGGSRGGKSAAPVGLGLALFDDPGSQSPSASEQPKPKVKRQRKPKHTDTGLPESFFPSSTPVSSLPPRLVPAAESVGSASGASSPAGTPFLPLDHPLPLLPAVGKVDHATLVKRAIQLEENQRKIWVALARKDIPKAYKLQSAGFQTKLIQTKKLAHTLSTHAKKPHTRTIATTKLTQVKSKRLMREMLVFWRKHDREEKDMRKKAERAQVDRAKAEEEKREAQRQARKLEFLISQTELYSHFVGNKLKTNELEEGADTATAPSTSTDAVPSAAIRHVEEDGGALDGADLPAIDFGDADERNLHRHAAQHAQDAIDAARRRAQVFDEERKRENEAATKRREEQRMADGDPDVDAEGEDEEEDEGGDKPPLVDLDSDELNFQNPTSLTDMTVAQPKMLMAQLKEYQLKGLNWLVTLYEQGINGILADEMGLGKTVQSISLLAYLAEAHGIWGPFLVIAPASTLHNWQQELTRFVPQLKTLPYWGNVKDRAVLRKFWNKKQICYDRDAPFHVLVTSYQLVVADEKYFQRVKWQYMVLDEAQAIKSSSSARWKTLLGFNCRNRLLLTGTPVQNSMQELWALLHFIMPSLFDSHDEFSEWFSKDIESAAENKGSALNEHQLRRLHMILKPFMLRRVKKNVQNELSEKIELDVYCDLSPRQRALYRGLRANVSIAELLERANNLGDADSARSLMNLVMQFRKVCNHPELFERADVVAPFSFATFSHSGILSREGDLLYCPDSARNPIRLELPALFEREGGLLALPGYQSRAGFERRWFGCLMSVWAQEWVHRRRWESGEYNFFRDYMESLMGWEGSAFGFMPFLGVGVEDVRRGATGSPLERLVWASDRERIRQEQAGLPSDPEFAAHSTSSPYSIPPRTMEFLEIAEGYPRFFDIRQDLWTRSCLSRPIMYWRSDGAVTTAIVPTCKDRLFIERQTRMLEAPRESLLMLGLPPSLRESPSANEAWVRRFPGVSPAGLVGASRPEQLPMTPMHVPEAKRLIYDSAKLARLDTLLTELKAGGHRVLIYFQMTRMIDLMEEYLVYRQYQYLRLDGGSKLEDRRDMVRDWQSNPNIFVFLLSTRAGGLGINLTAADTVVFYDHDWNPSNDAQAMDRAHRLGQTRQVTVYRLITKGTIDERIVQLARVKKDVQDIVVGNKQFTEATTSKEIVSLLLDDDQLANLATKGMPSVPSASLDRDMASGPSLQPMTTNRDLWADEGDEFFGSSTLGAQQAAADALDNAPVSSLGTPTGAGTPVANGDLVYGRGLKKDGTRKLKPGRKTGPGGSKAERRKKRGPITGDTLPDEL
ncbi:putative DNA helicase ino80 [Ceratobasidium sp. 414]|nr:putative DNA helicase ino80 [Ceratobasidium sp. 414]